MSSARTIVSEILTTVFIQPLGPSASVLTDCTHPMTMLAKFLMTEETCVRTVCKMGGAKRTKAHESA